MLSRALTTQVHLNVAGEARVTGDYVELLKPVNNTHHLRLSSSGPAMDINAQMSEEASVAKPFSKTEDSFWGSC